MRHISPCEMNMSFDQWDFGLMRAKWQRNRTGNRETTALLNYALMLLLLHFLLQKMLRSTLYRSSPTFIVSLCLIWHKHWSVLLIISVLMIKWTHKGSLCKWYLLVIRHYIDFLYWQSQAEFSICSLVMFEFQRLIFVSFVHHVVSVNGFCSLY